MLASRLASLESLLHREVPLSGHMGVEAVSYDGRGLVLAASLDRNINIHGTAFGGSMYSLAALCGWSLLRMRLEDRSLSAEVMLASASIDYQRPIRSRLMARGECDDGAFDTFINALLAAERARLAVVVKLGSGAVEDWCQAAVFNGEFATL